MARVYAELIRKGRKTFSEVPDKIKEEVRQVLTVLGYGELAGE